MTKSATPESDELRSQITKCFRDTYMETEGDTELFDTEETITAIQALIEAEVLRGKIDELRKVEQAGTDTFRARVRFVYTDQRLADLEHKLKTSGGKDG